LAVSVKTMSSGNVPATPPARKLPLNVYENLARTFANTPTCVPLCTKEPLGLITALRIPRWSVREKFPGGVHDRNTTGIEMFCNLLPPGATKNVIGYDAFCGLVLRYDPEATATRAGVAELPATKTSVAPATPARTIEPQTSKLPPPAPAA
jgi:hypothetical protein